MIRNDIIKKEIVSFSVFFIVNNNQQNGIFNNFWKFNKSILEIRIFKNFILTNMRKMYVF